MNLMECGLKGISCLFLDLLYETEPCMLQSGLGTLAAPKAHGKGLVPKIFTQIVASSSWCM